MLVNRPPMGWNTWNTFGHDCNDQLIRESADAMVDTGLAKCGYEYIVLDDCWSKKTRDEVTGRIVPDETKFPNGMKAVSDYVHSRGLKFGMYSCAGIRTCADYPGSFDHEFLDAETFADYGVDYLKYDYCYKPTTVDGPTLYHRMGIALENCGRDIVFSACNWGSDDVWHWVRATGAHLYRSTGDINDSFVSMRDIAFSQTDKFCFSGPNCYNDIDMLTVGMYGKGLVGTTGCNDADYRTQFSLWCMYSAPLMLGCDIRHMNEETLSLVTNPNLLAINQDPACRPPVWSNHPYNRDLKVGFKHLSNGKYALALYNLTEKEAEIPVVPDTFGITAASGYQLKLTDAMTNEYEGTFREYIRMKVAPHDCRVFLCELVK